MYIELFLEMIIPYITGLLEIVGVVIIVVASLKAVANIIRGGFNFNNEYPKIEFAKALALSLEFKLAAEILKTIRVRTLDEFLILAAITFLRIVINFVIHWEVKIRIEQDPTQENMEIQEEQRKKQKTQRA
mgnify:CR=1 FL=1